MKDAGERMLRVKLPNQVEYTERWQFHRSNEAAVAPQPVIVKATSLK